MIATDHFLYVHFFRTGGTFINEILKIHLRRKLLGYHRPVSLTPAELADLPVIGNVRNPWDWYVSVYFQSVNWNYPKGAGTLLNWLLDFRSLEFNEAVIRLLDTGWMAPEAEVALRTAPRLNAMSGTNSCFGRIAKSRINDYRTYRNDETATLVYEKDRELIDHFGYEF